MKKALLLLGLLCVNFSVFANIAPAPINFPGKINDFSLRFYQQIANTNSNLAFSPYGVVSLLAMLYPGAVGDTQTEMGVALGFTTPQQSLADFKQLTMSFVPQKTSDGSAFNFASAVWVTNGITINSNYSQSLSNFLYGQIRQADFQNNPAVAVTDINSWVATQTQNHITNLVDLKMITPNTRIVAVNTIYFHGLWQHAFDSSNTKSSDFNLENGQVVKVPMMAQTSSFQYSENNLAQMVILPYRDSQLAMAVILPQAKQPLAQFTQKFNLNDFQNLLANANQQQITVSLPKFIITSSFNSLQSNLINLGIKKAFTTQADFSALTTTMPLMLSTVIQKTYVSVDEEGTTAAAATGGMMTATAMLPKAFNANRPFLFVIFDMHSQTILFIGQVTNPVE